MLLFLPFASRCNYRCECINVTSFQRTDLIAVAPWQGHSLNSDTLSAYLRQYSMQEYLKTCGMYGPIYRVQVLQLIRYEISGTTVLQRSSSAFQKVLRSSIRKFEGDHS